MSSQETPALTELPTKPDLNRDDAAITAKLPIEPGYEMPIFFGVEQDILIAFLTLFRDHYRKCDKATTFLEHRTDIPNIASIANQRDAISHFKSALQPGTSREKRLQQYAAAEEHFRRAIIEPYETALKKKISILIPIYDRYRQEVLPVRDRHAELERFPDNRSLEDTLTEITRRRDAAREAKGHNIWDEIWEQGVEDYATGFDMADKLVNLLENGLIQLNQIKKDDETARKIKKLEDEIAAKDRKIEELSKSVS